MLPLKIPDVPQALTGECYVAKPPTGDDLIAAQTIYPVQDPWKARFLLMADKWSEQTDAIGNCNVKLRARDLWDNEIRGVP